MMKIQDRWTVLTLALLGMIGSSAHAQAPAEPLPSKIITRNKCFCLPIALEPRQRQLLQEVQLYVKGGAAEAWSLKESVPPTRDEFNYCVPTDGEYWFTIATVKKNSKLTPADVRRLTPGLIVIVDTQPPELAVHLLPPSPRGVFVECKVRDANPDPAQLRAEYQVSDKSWLALQPSAEDPTVFRLPGPVVRDSTVRVTATDRAGNTTTRVVVLGAATVGDSPPGPWESSVAPASLESRSDKVPVPVPDPSPTLAQSPPLKPSPLLNPAPPLAPSPSLGQSPVLNPARQLVGATHVSLDYQVEQQGPTGISKVEVWMTRDEGMTWQRLGEDPDRRSPVEFDLPGEGLYGISLVLTNGSGFGGTTPARGDTPDYWVEVDLTKPSAQLLGFRPGIGDEAGTLAITWQASDKNLGETPIDLYYATRRDGPWLPVARGLKNDGSFRWTLPRDGGPEFFFRMEVTDRAGNQARCDSSQPVVVDTTRPKARVLGIKASGSHHGLTPLSN
jgi:hypothetical protein